MDQKTIELLKRVGHWIDYAYVDIETYNEYAEPTVEVACVCEGTCYDKDRATKITAREIREEIRRAIPGEDT